jgi:hypothetical protein
MVVRALYEEDLIVMPPPGSCRVHVALLADQDLTALNSRRPEDFS